MSSRLLQGLPHSLLLKNANGELFIMLPACAKPTRPTNSNATFSTTLLLDRGDADWNKNIGDVRHYLYPLHMSRSFMFTPTLASALHLLLVRWLNRDYEAAFRLANACVCDTDLNEEEKQLFDLLGQATMDDLHPGRPRLQAETIAGDPGLPRDHAMCMEASLGNGALCSQIEACIFGVPIGLLGGDVSD